MIAVVGGTGRAGRVTVDAILAAGEEVRILSRTVPQVLPEGVEHMRFDLTGDDPAEALRGADVVLDLANAPGRPERTLNEGSTRLLHSCRAAGVSHYVGLSIVGCEQVGVGYYRAKAAQEGLIRSAPVSWSLLRASQFFDLVDGVMSATARFGFLPAGRAVLQPVDSEIVGGRLAAIATGRPSMATEQITGPDVLTLSELAETWRRATGRRALKLRLPLLGKTGRALRAGALTDPDSSAPGPGFEEWLEHRYR